MKCFSIHFKNDIHNYVFVLIHFDYLSNTNGIKTRILINWSKFVEWNDFWAEMFVHNFFEKMKEINCWHNYKQLDDTLPLLSAAITKYKTTIIVCIKQINSLIFLNEYRWNHSSSWFLKLKELEVIRHDKCIHLFLKTS